MTPATKRIGISLVIYLAWIAITLFGARLVASGETTLTELVGTRIGWHFGIAIVLLLIAIAVFRWGDMHFTKPHAVLRIMWFPVIYLILYAGLVIYVGLPPFDFVFFVAINTLLVGVSEEIMFRGILFRAFEPVMSIWPAIILTSCLFGAMHTLNVLITGELSAALLQSIAAGMSGVVFVAIVIRTGSIWPAIIYHFLWDCLIFLAAGVAHKSAPAVSAEESGTMFMYVPIVLNLPNLIFALFLLRKVGKQDGELQMT